MAGKENFRGTRQSARREKARYGISAFNVFALACVDERKRSLICNIYMYTIYTEGKKASARARGSCEDPPADAEAAA